MYYSLPIIQWLLPVLVHSQLVSVSSFLSPHIPPSPKWRYFISHVHRRYFLVVGQLALALKMEGIKKKKLHSQYLVWLVLYVSQIFPCTAASL